MHRLLVTTLTLCVLILASTLSWAVVDTPADLKIGPPETIKATKAIVDFSHTRHGSAKIECVTCHHTWDGKSEIQSCAAAGCHDQPGKTGNTAFYNAFHTKEAGNSCLGCHKIVSKQGKPVPVSCKACHAK